MLAHAVSCHLFYYLYIKMAEMSQVAIVGVKIRKQVKFQVIELHSTELMFVLQINCFTSI